MAEYSGFFTLQVDALVFDWLDAGFVDVCWECFVVVDVCPWNVNVQVCDRVDRHFVG